MNKMITITRQFGSGGREIGSQAIIGPRCGKPS